MNLCISLKYLRNRPHYSVHHFQPTTRTLHLPYNHVLRGGQLLRGLSTSNRWQIPERPYQGDAKSANSINKGYSGVAFLVASITSGIIGYSYAQTKQARAHTPIEPETVQGPQFGSPEDFKKGIDDLRQAFPSENTVSTDPEDLHHHGFSIYDYHPGTKYWMSYLSLPHINTGTCIRVSPQCGCVPRVH